jgi:hypothetical protein
LEGEEIGESLGFATDERAFDEGARVLAVQPEPTDVYFYELPVYEQDRRHDTRSRGRKRAFPFEDGYLSDFEKIAKPGFYFVEFRNGKTILTGGKVHEVRPQQTSAGASQTYTPQAAPTSPHGETSPGQVMLEAINAGRAFHSAAREIAGPATPSFTLADVERATKEAAREAVEQYKQVQPTQAPQPQEDATEKLVKTITSLRTLGLIPEREIAREQRNGLDEYLNVYRQMREIGAEVEPATEGKGFVAQVTSMVGDVARSLSAPGVQGLIHSLLPRPTQPTGAQPGATQQTQPQPEAAQVAAMPEHFAQTFEIVRQGITRDENESRAADALESLAESDETAAQMLAEVRATPSITLVQQLAAMTGAVYLSELPHAVAYIDRLKAELEDRERERAEESGEEAQGVDVASNGHKVASVAQPS